MQQTLLIRMLALRASGWNIKALAKEFDKDRTTIRFHLVRYDIQPISPVIKGQRRQKSPLIEEAVNPGKTYREYLLSMKKPSSFVEDFRGRTPIPAFKSTMQEDI